MICLKLRHAEKRTNVKAFAVFSAGHVSDTITTAVVGSSRSLGFFKEIHGVDPATFGLSYNAWAISKAVLKPIDKPNPNVTLKPIKKEAPKDGVKLTATERRSYINKHLERTLREARKAHPYSLLCTNTSF